MTNAPYDSNRVTSFKPADSGQMPRKGAITSKMVFIAPDPKFNPADSYYKDSRYVRAVSVTFYETAQTVSAYLTAYSRDGKTYISGNGAVGGGGYHMDSAAIEQALEQAGVTMAANFGGAGDRAIKHAIKALAKRLGWNTGQVMTF